MPLPTLIVTGASRGIGAATALLCAQRGWAVAVNYRRDEAAAHDVVQRITQAGGQAVAVQADVAHDGQVQALFTAVDAHIAAKGWGPLRGLVNNAGIVDVAQRVQEMGIERLQRMFAVNVFASFGCAREAVRRMSTRHGGVGGAIVNLSSAAARLGAPNQYVDYAAAKGAVEVLTHGLALEVAAEGIRVNALRPGLIDTEIHASGGNPDRARELAHLVPMRRPGTAQEVAHTIAWLLSDDEAGYVTGTVVDVSGGR